LLSAPQFYESSALAAPVVLLEYYTNLDDVRCFSKELSRSFDEIYTLFFYYQYFNCQYIFPFADVVHPNPPLVRKWEGRG
jgi:hypothetical protein